MDVILFTDLDNTLVSSNKNKSLYYPVQDIEFDNTNKSNPNISKKQKSLLTLFKPTLVIPVTGRNLSSLQRITIPFSSYKILDHGAIILNEDNQLDNLCYENIKRESPVWSPILHRYNDIINHYAESMQMEIRCKIIDDFGFDLYLSIKGPSEDVSEINRIFAHDFLNEISGGNVHFNDTNMALLPSFASKKSAVNYVIKHYLNSSPVTTVAAGDSNSDLSFMSICDFSIVPQESQIFLDKLSKESVRHE